MSSTQIRAISAIQAIQSKYREKGRASIQTQSVRDTRNRARPSCSPARAAQHPGGAISKAIQRGARRNPRKSTIGKAITRACGWAGARMVAGKSARHSRGKATQGGTGSKELCGTCAGDGCQGCTRQASSKARPGGVSHQGRNQKGARVKDRDKALKQSRAGPSTLPAGRPGEAHMGGGATPRVHPVANRRAP